MSAMADPLVGQVPAELEQLQSLYHRRRRKRVLEIGVWHGGTLREWLAGTPKLVVAVDPDPQTTDFDTKPGTELVFIVGRSQEEATIEQIREHAPYDWVFIDGDHAYDAVKADADLALSITSPGGLVLFHDIVAAETHGQTGPGQVFAELEVRYETWEIVEDPGSSGYPSSNAHGIGIVQL